MHRDVVPERRRRRRRSTSGRASASIPETAVDVARGLESDFAFSHDVAKFYQPHSAQQLPNGDLLLLDDGNDRPGGLPRWVGLILIMSTSTIKQQNSRPGEY